jgi:hypothetical protein
MVITAADSLMDRFSPTVSLALRVSCLMNVGANHVQVGCFRSWEGLDSPSDKKSHLKADNVDKHFLVIIDTMVSNLHTPPLFSANSVADEP